MVGGSPVGFEMDPDLFNAGGGGTIGDPCLLWTLNDYRLKPGNTLIGAGLDLYTLFGIDPGTHDYYGTSIPTGAAYDVGVHEFDANAVPVSKADNYIVKMNTTLNVDAGSGVLVNDFAYKGSLTAVLVSQASNGSVTLNSDGSFSYTPNTDFKGIDSFTYKANDGTDDSNISVVSIDVRDPKPVANDDSYYTYQDTTLAIDADDGVLANDEPSGVLTATLLSNPSNGTLSYFNSDGSFEYTPGLAFQGADNFTYKANWAGDDSNVATVTINVTEAVPWKHVVNNSFELNNAGQLITEKTTDMVSVMAWTNSGGGYCGAEPIELRDNPGSQGTCFAYAQHSGDTSFYQIIDHNIAADTRYTLLWDGDNIWQKNPTIITSFFHDDPNTGHTEITSKSFSLTAGWMSGTIRWGEDIDLPMEFITPSSAAYIGEKIGVKFSFVNGGGSVYTAVDRVRLNIGPLELAWTPNPADEVEYVPTGADLSWTAGSYADSHDVYFGTNVTAVIDADHSSPEFKGNQTGTTYDPGIMAVDTAYYWRIDEVDGGTYTGEVWSFTTQGPDYVANGETAISGLLSLDYTATQYSNTRYEWIREVESAGGPQTRYSYMEHKWTFDIPASGETVTFYVEAFHTENEDNDDFVFAYSTDDVSYTDMLTVTKTSDDDTYQSYELPGSTSGTVYIRAMDTDQTAGNGKLDRIYVDHMYIRSGIAVPDTDPPTPDPMTFATPPYATGSTSIAMVATTASDPSGVEYYFSCVSGGGNDSGWQSSTSYEDTGLTCETSYSYRVQARDLSANQNATAWSTTESATTGACGGDTTPPEPDPMTFATLPYATGSTSIAMVATTASDPSGVEYYFTCVSGGGNDSGWQDSTSYEDTGLSCETQYCYTVEARDKSPNQNTTAPSSSACATTGTCGGGPVIFSDGFESGDFATGGWTRQNTSASVTKPSSYTGTYGAKLKKTTWIEKAISTAGYTDIHVKYARWTSAGFDAGENLYVEWWDGSDWNVLETVPGGIGWTLKDQTCGAGADNNANFKVKFRTNANQNNESAYVDDVEITGTAM